MPGVASNANTAFYLFPKTNSMYENKRDHICDGEAGKYWYGQKLMSTHEHRQYFDNMTKLIKRHVQDDFEFEIKYTPSVLR